MRKIFDEFEFSTIEVVASDDLEVSIGLVHEFDVVDVSATDDISLSIESDSDVEVFIAIFGSDNISTSLSETIYIDDDPSEPIYAFDTLGVSLLEDVIHLRESFAPLLLTPSDVTLPPERVRRHEPERRILPLEARRGQSVYKIKLNSHNGNLKKNMEYLENTFSDFGDTFYDRFLGPALSYRLDVSRKTLPTGSSISREIEGTSQVLDTNLKASLADQMRRRDTFNRKMEEVFEDIRERDKYRDLIKDLSYEGKPVPSKGPHVMVPTEEDAADVDYWRRIEEAGFPEGESLLPSHGDLVDLETEDAHSQYYLRSGDTMSDNLELEEGVRVDGMRPSTHRHTGGDGTLQIRGEHILSLVEDNVDVDDVPPIPYELEVLNYSEKIAPPGVMTIDSSIKFKGHPRYQYEVQITPLISEEERERVIFAVDSVAAGIYSPPGGEGEFMHDVEGD